MKTLPLAASLVAMTAATSAFADAHAMAGISGYALAGEGRQLVVMTDIGNPADVSSYNLRLPVDAIAWRPVTAQLLGFSNGAIYVIDPMTGEMTNLSATFMEDAIIADGAAVAFDFNNQIDAVRAVSSAGDNLVYFPAGFGDNDERANSVRRFTDLAYGADDAMATATPMVFANAYTNAINGTTASETFQYAIDAQTDTLISLANNAGTLATIGKITVDGAEVDLAPLGDMDIVSPAEGQNMAYAVLNIEGETTSGLYSLDLGTGAATLLAQFADGGFTGFAASMGQ